MTSARASSSILDIANACSVSRWTVSAVLFPSAKNKHVGCSDSTRKKIIATARKLNYRPHRASRMLHQRHGVLGILTSQFFSIPWASLQAMLSAAQSRNQIISLESFAAASTELPLFIRENVVDGLLVFEAVTPLIEQALERYAIPTVHVNTCVRRKFNAINMDETGATRRAVSHFAQTGRRRPVLIVGDGSALFEVERIAAFEQACSEFKLGKFRILRFSGVQADPSLAQKLLHNFLAEDPPCDSVIAPHDAFVGMIFKSCRQLRIKIPTQLSIICMQNPDRLLHFEPAVSAFDLPERTLGELAVSMLNQALDTAQPVDSVLLPYQFMLRES